MQETGWTQLLYQMAASQTLTLRQAALRLQEDAHIRALRETLAKYAGLPPEDKSALQSFYTQRLLDSSPPGTARASLERKVRMWLGEDVQSISKQGAIQLCFALGLGVEEAGTFLHRTCGEGFHWRDAGELVYLYALEEGLAYPKAQALWEAMKEKGLLTGGKGTEAHTALVRQEARQLGSEEALEEYLREHQDQLGAMHNTAYELFRAYLDLLSDPESENEGDKQLSVRKITDTYLHQRFIPRIKKAAKNDKTAEDLVLSALQRSIQQSWPDETTLSKMLNRKIDVSRKALILLFLATDGDTKESLAAQDWYDLEEDLEEEPFEDLYARLDAMLLDCGFAPLDSRAPFDWMVLYFMCARESIFIDGRIQRFLGQIFPPEVRPPVKPKDEPKP